MQYIPQKNMKSATGFFRIVIFYFHFVSFIFLMEPRGSSYFSSEHAVCFPVDYRLASAKHFTSSYGKSRAHGVMRPFFVGD